MVTKKGAGAYRRKWRRKGYGFSFKKAISRYHYTKLTYNNRISLTATAIKFVTGGNNTLAMYTMLEACPDWAMYKKLFLSYKVCGVAIVASPAPAIEEVITSTTQTGTFPVGQVFFNSVPVIGLMAQGEGSDYKDIAESNKHLLLNYVNTSRTFWRLDGGITGWDGTQAANDQKANLSVNVDSLPTYGAKFWSLLVDFYVMFKITV